MDTALLQLDSRVFRLVCFRVRGTGDLDSVELGSERVGIEDSIRDTGYIGRRVWIHAIAAAAGLVNVARWQLPTAHVVVIASEAVASAKNSEGFFEALRRTSGVAPEVLLPAEIVTLITRSAGPPPRRSPSIFPVPL